MGEAGNNPSLQARDLMQREVVTVHEDASLADVCDMLQQAHIHGIPVVTDGDRLVGFVSQEDILYGSMSGPPEDEPPADAVPAGGNGGNGGFVTRVGDVMTAPPVAATEETDVADLCKMMWRLRLHHIPIVVDGRLTGIVSSLDLCRAIAEGKIPA